MLSEKADGKMGKWRGQIVCWSKEEHTAMQRRITRQIGDWEREGLHPLKQCVKGYVLSVMRSHPRDSLDSERVFHAFIEWRAQKKTALVGLKETPPPLGRRDGCPVGTLGTHEGKPAKNRLGGVAKDGAQRKRDHDQRQRDMGRKLASWWVTPDEKTALFVKLLEIRRGNDNG